LCIDYSCATLVVKDQVHNLMKDVNTASHLIFCQFEKEVKLRLEIWIFLISI
jgi:hypothetical protein